MHSVPSRLSLRSGWALVVALGLATACGSDDDLAGPEGSGPNTSSGGSSGPGSQPGTEPGSGADGGTQPGTDGGTTEPDRFNNYLRPYAADSPWNSRPVGAVLGTATIPDSVMAWRPVISDGKGFSTGVFLAVESDPPMVVKGNGAGSTIYDKDVEEKYPSITIPHWPADVFPATEGDGHADIVDETLKIVHSFNGLRKAADGTWAARDYGWSRLDGRGWGDPAHYFQGARATGVPASAGIVRKHEFLGTDAVYRHALSLSLPHNAIKKGEGDAPTAYVYPATQGDGNDPSLANSGQIPEGALLMLPADFDSSTMPTPELVRIAETLKTYGAYVTDRNHATPFNIYVEIGTGYSLGPAGAAVDGALATLQHALRPLESAASWVDGYDRPTLRHPKLELQTMRGKWSLPNSGTVIDGSYATWQQAVVLPEAGISRFSGWNNDRVSWGKNVAGTSYRVEVETTGGATVQYKVYCDAPNAGTKADSGVLSNGQGFDLVWPTGTGRCTPQITVVGGAAGATARARLHAAGE